MIDDEKETGRHWAGVVRMMAPITAGLNQDTDAA